jgi:predicted PurR-regulated permease PerM
MHENKKNAKYCKHCGKSLNQSNIKFFSGKAASTGGWIFGIIFIFSGIITLFSHFFTGLFLIILGCFLIPNLNRVLTKKLNLKIKHKIIIIIFLLILIPLITPTNDGDIPETLEVNPGITRLIEQLENHLSYNNLDQKISNYELILNITSDEAKSYFNNSVNYEKEFRNNLLKIKEFDDEI